MEAIASGVAIPSNEVSNVQMQAAASSAIKSSKRNTFKTILSTVMSGDGLKPKAVSLNWSNLGYITNRDKKRNAALWRQKSLALGRYMNSGPEVNDHLNQLLDAGGESNELVTMTMPPEVLALLIECFGSVDGFNSSSIGIRTELYKTFIGIKKYFIR